MLKYIVYFHFGIVYLPSYLKIVLKFLKTNSTKPLKKLHFSYIAYVILSLINYDIMLEKANSNFKKLSET